MKQNSLIVIKINILLLLLSIVGNVDTRVVVLKVGVKDEVKLVEIVVEEEPLKKQQQFSYITHLKIILTKYSF